MLRVMRRGVYALGVPGKSWSAALTTATLAAGPGAAISHESGSVLHGMRRRHERRIHVTVPHNGGHDPEDLKLHHVRSLDPADITRIDGIPVTTLERTLLDLAETSSLRTLGRMVHELEVQRRLDVVAVDAVIARNPGRHGIRPLRLVLEKHRARDKAAVQERLYRLALRAGFPKPSRTRRGASTAFSTNSTSTSRRSASALEADGYAVHGTARRFWSDRHKDRRLWLVGIDIKRYTWEDVTTRARETVAELRAIRDRLEHRT